jgi:hypothetical protein
MTLGRSPSGAIKIKTDGGLRAVECACCGGIECQITEEQLNNIRYGGTTGIAGMMKQIEFFPDYEFSYFDDEGNEQIIGYLFAPELAYSETYPGQCWEFFDFEPWQFRNSQDVFIPGYGIYIPANPAAQRIFTFGLGGVYLDLAIRSCYLCSGQQVEGAEFPTIYQKLKISPPCGDALYKAFMEYDSTYLTETPGSPCP